MEKMIKRIQLLGLTCDVRTPNGARHFHCGHEYVEIGGIKWATMNVGAKELTDSGLYFSWGETKGYTDAQVHIGKKCFNFENYKFGNWNNPTKYNGADGKTTLELCNDAATVNMGSNWRMPTADDFEALFNATTSTWVSNYQGSGVNGWLFTDKTDGNKVLFFPAVGFCSDYCVDYVGNVGYYWSSSLGVSNIRCGCRLYFDRCGYSMSSSYRYFGFSVRGIQTNH